MKKNPETPEKQKPLGRVVMETKQLAELIPADYNPRKISESALAGLKSSIKAFDLVQPIVWNKLTGNVVSGHQRLRSLQELGVEETDVVVVELDEIKEKALNVTMNNKAIEGEFDEDLLSGLLEEVAQFNESFFKDLKLDSLVPPTISDIEDPGENGEPKFGIRKVQVLIHDPLLEQSAVKSQIELACAEFAGRVEIK